MSGPAGSGMRQHSDSPRIIGVNGIRSGGEKNTDLLLGALHGLGHGVVDFDYGEVGFFTARSVSRQKAIGHRLRETSRPGDHVIAHSYGGLVTLRAMQAGAKFGQVFLFAPAMNSDFTFPLDAATHIWIFHCPSDLALIGGALLVKHAFGSLGRVGYKGPADARVHNVKVPSQFLAHSAYFSQRQLAHWSVFIDARLREGTAPAATGPAGIPARD